MIRPSVPASSLRRVLPPFALIAAQCLFSFCGFFDRGTAVAQEVAQENTAASSDSEAVRESAPSTHGVSSSSVAPKTLTSSEAQLLRGAASSGDGSASASSAGGDALQMALSLLPEGDSAEASPLRVVGSNAYQIKLLILPELFPLVRDGGLQFSAYRRSRYSVSDDEEWMRAGVGRAVSFGADGIPEFGADRFKRGFPFGSFNEILRRSSALSATELLWNVAARRWSSPLIKASFDLSVVKEQRIERQLQGVVTRLHPHEQGETAGQVFREFMQFTSPSVVSNYRFLSFRFLGNEEDLVWMYSPAIKQVRQLTGANRSDLLFRTGVSLDDLFLWSTKPESVEGRVDRVVTALVPFAGLEPLKLGAPVGNDPCSEIELPTLGAPGSDEGFEFAPIIPEAEEIFFPEGTVAIPRELIRLTLNPRDPFGLNGRVILYLDKQLQIPVAKIVFDRAGQLWKIGLAGLALAVSEDGSRKEPFVKFAVLADRKTQTLTTLDFTSAAFCSEIPSTISRDFFDPARLGPPPEQKEEASEKTVHSPSRPSR